MIFQTEIAEDGSCIRITISERDEDLLTMDLEIDECREVIQMISDAIIKATALKSFSSHSLKTKN